MSSHAPRQATPTVVAPALDRNKFTCFACGLYTGQKWIGLQYEIGVVYPAPLKRAQCTDCGAESYWHNDGRMIDPESIGGIPASEDMPEDVFSDFSEAAAIVERSPRAACALLRLATERMLRHHPDAKPNDSLNENIKRLARSGKLAPSLEDVMHTLRLAGNDAVHPAMLGVADDPEVAHELFWLVNVLVEEFVTRDKRIEAIRSRVTGGASPAIEASAERPALPPPGEPDAS